MITTFGFRGFRGSAGKRVYLAERGEVKPAVDSRCFSPRPGRCWLPMHESPSAALAAALLFGAGAPAAKALLGGVDPTLLAGLLYLGSGITLGLARVVLRPDAARFARRAWVWLASAILAGAIVAPILLLWGLSRTSASTASLLLVLEAPLTAV